MTDVLLRLARVYASVQATFSTGLGSMRAHVTIDGNNIAFEWPSGDRPVAELENAAQAAIANVSSLRDHMKKWASGTNRSTEPIDRAIYNCFEYRVVHDLWNREKHSGDVRNGGLSKRNPVLRNVRSVVRLETRPEKGSWVGVSVSLRDGTPRAHGDGSTAVVVTGDIIDSVGNPIGDLYEFLSRAVAMWEEVLGTLLPSTPHH